MALDRAPPRPHFTCLSPSFAAAKKTIKIVDPVFVRSFAEAQRRIQGSEIFHIVILDLNLPMETRGQPVEGLAPGQQLLEAFAKRDAHPVPVLLVVSGKLNLAQPIGSMQERLQKDFWYGRLINKGPEQFGEIAEGLKQALRYIDVGIHIRDVGKEVYPPLSPREEDLLRRCILAQSSCLGVDLQWWSAETGPSYSHPTPSDGPTKVLMGHFLLDDGRGPSIPTFFKFEPAGNGPAACRDVSILAQKLGHVKVYHTFQSRQRCLIVTQSVTNRGRPISLDEYLHGDPSLVGVGIVSVIDQVVAQLSQLAEPEDDEVVVGTLLWEYLDRPAMQKAWNSCDTRQLEADGFASPLLAFDQLKTSKAKIWASRRNCIHGDLNATNVAIDASDPANPRAYVFDAAGMHADFDLRDLATLEVTTVLFNSCGADETLLDAIKPLYGAFTSPPTDLAASAFAKNVLSTIQAIRSRFADDATKLVYACVLFSAALQQLSGLGFQPSPNKVKNPMHACYLAAWIAKWLRAIAPQFFMAPSVHTSG